MGNMKEILPIEVIRVNGMINYNTGAYHRSHYRKDIRIRLDRDPDKENYPQGGNQSKCTY